MKPSRTPTAHEPGSGPSTLRFERGIRTGKRQPEDESGFMNPRLMSSEPLVDADHIEKAVRGTTQIEPVPLRFVDGYSARLTNRQGLN